MNKIAIVKPNNNHYNRQSFKMSPQKNPASNITDLGKMPHYPISFQGGLKNNLRIAESILNDFKKEYPKIKSDTLVGIKIEQFQNKSNYTEIIPKLKNLEFYLSDRVQNMRYNYKGRSYKSLDDYLLNLTSAIRKSNNHFNCTECSDIIQYMLLKRGVPAHNIALNIKKIGSDSNKINGDHSFTVIGLKKGADLSNTKTWGTNAVIIDGWANFALPLKNALTEYERIFAYNVYKHHMDYSSANKVNIDKYLNLYAAAK